MNKEEPRLYHIPLKIRRKENEQENVETLALLLTPSQYEQAMKKIHRGKTKK